MHNRQRIPKYAPDLNLFDGGFEATEDYFSDAEKDEWAMPGHIDMDCVPGEAEDFFPSPEDVLLARETNLIELTVGQRESIERVLDFVERFESNEYGYDYYEYGYGYYDFDEQELAALEKDDENDALPLAHVLEEVIDMELVRKKLLQQKRHNGRSVSCYDRDGNRQLPSIRRAQEKRIGRQIKYGKAA